MKLDVSQLEIGEEYYINTTIKLCLEQLTPLSNQHSAKVTFSLKNRLSETRQLHILPSHPQDKPRNIALQPKGELLFEEILLTSERPFDIFLIDYIPIQSKDSFPLYKQRENKTDRIRRLTLPVVEKKPSQKLICQLTVHIETLYNKAQVSHTSTSAQPSQANNIRQSKSKHRAGDTKRILDGDVRGQGVNAASSKSSINHHELEKHPPSKIDVEDVKEISEEQEVPQRASETSQPATPEIEERSVKEHDIIEAEYSDEITERFQKIAQVVDTVKNRFQVEYPDFIGEAHASYRKLWTFILDFEDKLDRRLIEYRNLMQQNQSTPAEKILPGLMMYLVDSIDQLLRNSSLNASEREKLEQFNEKIVPLILAHADMEIIPIELFKTPADVKIHNVSETKIGDYPEGVVIEVREQGLRSKSDKHTIRKATVVQGQKG